MTSAKIVEIDTNQKCFTQVNVVGIVVSSGGVICVAYSTSEWGCIRVEEFSPQGDYIHDICTLGPVAGTLKLGKNMLLPKVQAILMTMPEFIMFPPGLVPLLLEYLPDENLYVLSHLDNKAYVYDGLYEAELMTICKLEGWPSDSVHTSCAISPVSGELYVAHPHHSDVFVYEGYSGQTVLCQTGLLKYTGTLGPSVFSTIVPTAMAVTRSGDIYVNFRVEMGQRVVNYIQLFSSTEKPETIIFMGSSRISAISVAENGIICALESQSDRLRLYAPMRLRHKPSDKPMVTRHAQEPLEVEYYQGVFYITHGHNNYDNVSTLPASLLSF